MPSRIETALRERSARLSEAARKIAQARQAMVDESRRLPGGYLLPRPSSAYRLLAETANGVELLLRMLSMDYSDQAEVERRMREDRMRDAAGAPRRRAHRGM